MSNDPARSAIGTDTADADDMDAVKNDPVLQGHSALNDPDLSGSTAAVWTGTGGPDPGGVAGPAELDRQGGGGDSASSGSAMSQAVSSTADQAQQAIGQAADQAQQVAGQVVDTAKAQTTDRLSAGKDQIATTVDTVAQSIRQSSQGLRDQDQAAVAGYADQAADRLAGAASYLRERDVTEIVADVEDFARRQPAAFLGAAFGLGLLAARFIKSSRQQSQASQRYGMSASYRSDSNTAPATGAWPGAASAGLPGYPIATANRGGADLTADRAQGATTPERLALRAEAPLPSAPTAATDDAASSLSRM